MSEKMYTFEVPVTIRAVRTIYLHADNDWEARKRLMDIDWFNHEDSAHDDEHDWDAVSLVEVTDCEEQTA